MTESFFDFSPAHVLMAVLGGIIFLAFWLPRVLLGRLASSSALLMLLGLVAALAMPNLFARFDPTISPGMWESSTEIVLIIVLFATGLRIDSMGTPRSWLPAAGLLAVSMPLTIIAVAALGWWLAGMTLAGAILLGSALAPTDPVLAGDVQIGPPLEGSEHPVRFALTTEAGLNDGFAFPFVFLGLLIAAGATDLPGGLGIWFLRDALYPIATGAILGAGIGWLLGKSLFHVPRDDSLARSGPGVIALAAVLLCYGLVALAQANGFVGAFVAGLVCRRVEARNQFHRRLHTFSGAIESAVTAVLLVFLGSTLPALWHVLDWRHSVIGFGLLLVIRPLAGWLGLLGSDLSSRERWAVAFFGVRGVGTIYYIAYASGHVEFVNEAQLWALMAYTIFASTVLHGATGFIIERIAPLDGATGPPPDPASDRRGDE